MITRNKNKNIALRNAEIGDAADLAILDNIASHGLSLWFWQGAVLAKKAEDALQWGRQRMADPKSPFGYHNAVVALQNSQVSGSATGYIAQRYESDSAKAEHEVMAPIYRLYNQCAGDWFLDSLAVYDHARGNGIGAALLDNCFERARGAGTKNFGLVAEDSNAAALTLYKSRGLKQIDQAPYVAFNDHATTKNWLLFKAEIH